MNRAVLLIGTFLSGRGGYRGVCEDLAERLMARGWSVITASTKLGPISRVADMMLTTWRNRRVYGAAQVDVYSGRAFIWAELVCWLLRRTGHPYVLTL